MTSFAHNLICVELLATTIHEGKKLIDLAALDLLDGYNAGEGNKRQRTKAADQLEDAGLIPWRLRDETGKIIG